MANTIAGLDGFLFLSNDTNASIDQVTGRYKLSHSQIQEISSIHSARLDFARGKLDALYLHMIVPNKEIVLQHLLPQNIRFQSDGLTPVNFYLETCLHVEKFTFYRPNFLRSLHGERSAFPKTDTHWSHFASAQYLIEAFRKHMGAAMALTAQNIVMLPSENEMVGDLGSKLDLRPEMVETLAPDQPKSELIFTNGIQNEGCVRLLRHKIRTSPERLLFLHDSTGNWIIPLLAEVFGEVLAIHCPDLDPKVAVSFGPSHIIFCQIERFFVRIPSNKISYLDFVAQQETQKNANTSALPFLKALLRD